MDASPPSPFDAERDQRLSRLSRHASSLLSAYGVLLSLAPVSDAPAAADVDLARTRATTAVLTSHVEGLLALLREVRLDAFLLTGGGAAEAMAVDDGGDAEGALR